jgi:hypothetical protein
MSELRETGRQRQAKKTPQGFLATIYLLCHKRADSSNCGFLRSGVHSPDNNRNAAKPLFLTARR